MSSIGDRILSMVYGWYVYSFFKEIKVIGGENVPSHGPVIICCTHPNSLLDPILLSKWSPNGRKYRFWTLASMFSFPLFAAILRKAGCLPVESNLKVKHGILFKDTFELLTAGEVVALFPEGTSHSESQLLKLKDGASWAALKYAKHIRRNRKPSRAALEDVKVVVASTVYTDKTAYRSRAIIQYSKPLDISLHIDQFLSSPDEQAMKGTVKGLTEDIRRAMLAISINAPDKNTLELANLARQVLWTNDDAVPLSYWTEMTQRLVLLFSEISEHASLAVLTRHALSTYSNALRALDLNHASLSSFFQSVHSQSCTGTGPSSLVSIARALYSCTPSFLIALPFFIIPAIVHIPAYITCLIVERSINKTMPEQLANVKIQYSALVLICFVYPASTYLVRNFWFQNVPGFVIACVMPLVLVACHGTRIDGMYSRWKRVSATWKIALNVGVAKLFRRNSKTLELLKLRWEASEKLTSLLLMLEERHDSSVLKDEGPYRSAEPCKFSSELVKLYRSCGARLESQRQEQ